MMKVYLGWLAAAVFAAASLVQIAPIQINPWSWLFGFIGRAINGEVLKQLNDLSARMDKMESKNEQDKMETARIRILRFGDECKRKEKHSEEHFNQVLDDIDKYEAYCATHPEFKNAKAVITIANIKAHYAERLENGDFL